jgi:hypothetical protein
VGEVIWGVTTSSCWGGIGEQMVVAARARREKRVLKIIVRNERRY